MVPQRPDSGLSEDPQHPYPAHARTVVKSKNPRYFIDYYLKNYPFEFMKGDHQQITKLRDYANKYRIKYMVSSYLDGYYAGQLMSCNQLRRTSKKRRAGNARRVFYTEDTVRPPFSQSC